MKRLILALLIVASIVFLVSWTPDETARIGDEEKEKYFELAEEILNGVGSGNSNKEPLNVILIWHQHQPLYKIPGTLEYEMPWVRAHAVNDYPYMADLVYEYLDKGGVTFNYVPSLLLQINDYLENDVMDEYMRLSYKESLTEEEKEFVIEHFFDINPQFVEKSSRYTELQEKKSNSEEFNDQNLIDLKVLWNLHWINADYIENDNRLAELVKQDGNYTMDDVNYVLDKHLQIMETIVEKHKSLWQEEKVEMITSPFYHPILPILIDKGWKEDAVNQIGRGLDYFEELFGKKPAGLWPPEQAVHDELVNILPDFGLEWTVTDEAILQKAGVSTGNIKNLLKPYRIKNNGKELIVFFRDTELSDKIGFNYSSMTAENAVKDFITRLHELQELNDKGNAVIAIALDGENAWEHYPNNGNDFRKLLYATLSSDSLIKMVTPEDYLSHYNVEETLDYLPTGSWAGGSLDTWIGEKEEDEGWERVAQAREHLMDVKDKISSEALELATDALYVAEGSDWFWWYGADQDAGNNEVLFDKAFKRSLIQLYKVTGITE
ncbi:MAG: glycoside hydrolase family 57 protein, partial [Thermotogota bacterium]|nr:glycoside hydrolase family 57 protein [Thermotogota bacterium]